jgi:hypothetical protein
MQLRINMLYIITILNPNVHSGKKSMHHSNWKSKQKVTCRPLEKKNVFRLKGNGIAEIS